jgi:hypothetical protein
MTEKDPTKGSGVLIAVHNSIICSELFPSNNTELIMDRIVEPSFCANDNIGLSSFDKIVQESFLISDALEIDV